MSEIDDIFAKRPLASTSAAPPVDQPKKKKSKKGKVKEPGKDETENVSKSSPSSKKRAAPETVVDTSSRPVPAQKKIKLAKHPPAPAIGKEEENKFTDSRGSGPSSAFSPTHRSPANIFQNGKRKKGGRSIKRMSLVSKTRVETPPSVPSTVTVVFNFGTCLEISPPFVMHEAGSIEASQIGQMIC